MVGSATMPAPATWTSGAPVFSFVVSLISGCRWLVGARTSSTRTRVLPSPVRLSVPAMGIVPPPMAPIGGVETGRTDSRSTAPCRSQISRFEQLAGSRVLLAPPQTYERK